MTTGMEVILILVCKLVSTGLKIISTCLKLISTGLKLISTGLRGGDESHIHGYVHIGYIVPSRE